MNLPGGLDWAIKWLKVLFWGARMVDGGSVITTADDKKDLQFTSTENSVCLTENLLSRVWETRLTAILGYMRN